MRSKQSGFTLIEIAIVLVIIGLLLGGVLKGQELINSAKIKNVANDLNGISAAVYSYQDRYKTYPGDDDGATARWGAAAKKGNKSGVLGGEFCGPTTLVDSTATVETGESALFWQHLRFAGFIGGDTASGEQPQNALGGIVGVQTGSGLPATPDISSLVVCTSNLNGKIAEAIDRQFDDGLANKGTLQGYLQAGPIARGCTDAATSNFTRAAHAATYDASDDTKLYTVCKSL
ncbi:MAG: prepilin-type N-terminal cleavage/methylation domain-containing protein [Sulfuritalea sp.]|nr:prepilin-type N-terminal cleavage/methylation domain-containing protein [Sulfuritalea sp.]